MLKTKKFFHSLLKKTDGLLTLFNNIYTFRSLPRPLLPVTYTHFFFWPFLMAQGINTYFKDTTVSITSHPVDSITINEIVLNLSI